MVANFKAEIICKKIGHSFEEVGLLKRAMTHRSRDAANNERLEFLGDSIVNFVIADTLFARFPNAREGELSRLRASLVKGETLAQVARTLQLGEFLLLGEGELKSGGHRRSSILADALEALIGAIYLDAGMAVAGECIQRWFTSQLANLSLEDSARDPKSRLQEWLQARGLPLPNYEIVENTGEAHNQSFTVSCCVTHNQNATRATASSRKQAEKEAAKAMLDTLELGASSRG